MCFEQKSWIMLVINKTHSMIMEAIDLKNLHCLFFSGKWNSSVYLLWPCTIRLRHNNFIIEFLLAFIYNTETSLHKMEHNCYIIWIWILSGYWYLDDEQCNLTLRFMIFTVLFSLAEFCSLRLVIRCDITHILYQ